MWLIQLDSLFFTPYTESNVRKVVSFFEWFFYLFCHFPLHHREWPVNGLCGWGGGSPSAGSFGLGQFSSFLPGDVFQLSCLPVSRFVLWTKSHAARERLGGKFKWKYCEMNTSINPCARVHMKCSFSSITVVKMLSQLWLIVAKMFFHE